MPASSVALKNRERRFSLAALLLVAFFSLILGIVGHILFSSPESPVFTRVDNTKHRLLQSDYPLVDPLLACEPSQQKKFDEGAPLRSAVQKLIDSSVASRSATQVSVYLQDYATGNWVDINGSSKYSPASLLKVPLMISYFKLAETTPKVLESKLSYNGDDQNSDEYFKAASPIKPNEFYTVDEMIDKMIAESDNTSTTLLSQSINEKSRDEVFNDLGVSSPQNPASDYMTVKDYAYFFRVLYNATYLTRSFSEKALEVLTTSHFTEGIKGGIPVDVKAATKFGERTVMTTTGTLVERELHDCGIVYKKDSPYLLCVMTKGQDFDKLADTIRSISKLVYDEVGK